LIIPSSALHGFVLQSDIVGEVFTFLETFYEQCLKNETGVKLKLNRLQQFVISEDQVLFEDLSVLKKQLLEEIKVDRPKKEAVLEMFLSLFLITLYRISIHSTTNIIRSDDRTLSYFIHFKS
jgi:AraC family transcriptional activator of pobA